MSPTLTCLALALVGVDLGYKPPPMVGRNSSFQISPATLQAARPGGSESTCREARETRPSHFSIRLGNETLPKVLAASILPATAPIVTASPVMLGRPRYRLRVGPAARQRPSRRWAAFVLWRTFLFCPAQVNHSTRLAAADTPKLCARLHQQLRRNQDRGPPAVNPHGGALAEPDRPWLVMCLFVIALASNVYVGWLFLDARQRYRGLLTGMFSLGEQAAEA